MSDPTRACRAEAELWRRRTFLRTSGLLIASVAAISLEGVEAFLQRPPAAGPYPDLDFLQLDSWIVIRPDNTATFFVGKTDLGQGTGTAFRQIMSDELDIAFENTTCVMGSTDVTVDQGGSGGSDALQTDGYPMRRVAAEARRVLLDMGAAALRRAGRRRSRSATASSAPGPATPPIAASPTAS